ncbi:unnamed protein product, partial [Allacma fusca]|jgi:hypothetical protein
MADG